MQVPILLPELGLLPEQEPYLSPQQNGAGTTLGPAVLSIWYARVGDEVYEGDRLVEILADSVTFDVPAPASGRLVQQLAFPNDALRPGQTLGVIEAQHEEE